MRKIIISLLLLLCMSVVFSEVKRTDKLVAISGKKYYMHKVEAKETMYAISKAYAVSISSILEENKKKNSDLREGELLKIPYVEPNTVLQSMKYKHYIVKKGDTLYSLAKKFGTSEQELITLNAGIDVALVEGRRLIVPLIDESQPRYDNEYYYHIVKSKETLSSIGRRYGISARKLRQINEEINPSNLKPNDEVRIPIGNARAEVARIRAINKKTKGQKEVLVIKDASEKNRGTLIEIPETYEAQEQDIIKGELDYDVEEPGDYRAEFKNEYEMVVMLPFKKSFVGMINYYKGMLLAIKQNEDVPVSIYTYDSERSQRVVKERLQKHKNADFIVGPYGYDVFPAALPYANEKTTLVSLISKNEAVYKNENVLQFNTTERSINRKISEYVVREHLSDNVVYFDGRTFKYYQEVKGSPSEQIAALTELINTLQDKGEASEKDYREDFKRVFNKAKKNIVIVPESNYKIVNQVLNALNVYSMHNVEVIGYYKWKLLPNIDPEMLFNLNVTYFTPFHYLSTSEENFTKAYKEEFYSFPDDFSYMGYETMRKLLEGLKEGGKYFYKKPFQKIQKHKLGGYENIDLHKVQFKKNFEIIVE